MAVSAPILGGSRRARQSLRSAGVEVALIRAGGAVQGRVLEEADRRVFVRPVTWARHFFRLDDGWSISASVLAQLHGLCVDVLRYADDAGGTWEVTLAEFLRLARRRDYADETQFILPRAHWAHTPPTPRPAQLSLFAAAEVVL